MSPLALPVDAAPCNPSPGCFGMPGRGDQLRPKGKGSVQGTQHSPVAAQQLQQGKKPSGFNAFNEGCKASCSLRCAMGNLTSPWPCGHGAKGATHHGDGVPPRCPQLLWGCFVLFSLSCKRCFPPLPPSPRGDDNNTETARGAACENKSNHVATRCLEIKSETQGQGFHFGSASASFPIEKEQQPSTRQFNGST